MDFILREDVVSLTDFARNTKQHTQELADCGRPRILTQNGKAVAVVLSPEAFEKMAHDAKEHLLDMRLQKTIQAHLAGAPGIPEEEAFERLRKSTLARRDARK